MATLLSVGSLVTVHNADGNCFGRGMIDVDNEDGTWNVSLEDGTDGDFPAQQLSVRPKPVDELRLRGGIRVVAEPLLEEKPEGWTRFVCFSDTHGLHGEIPKAHIVKGDVLLHAGDFTNTGEVDQVRSFAEWLRSYPTDHKIVIAGNHDITFQPDYYERSWSRFHAAPFKCDEARQSLLSGDCCTYLQDSETEVMGYRIYGSPWQPQFADWAFQPQEGADCAKFWNRIPTAVDILLTHGPASGMCDACSTGAIAGCTELLSAIKSRAVPLSVCGHIHDAYGTDTDGVTLFVNASTCTHRYKASNRPVVLDVPPAADLRNVTRSLAATR